LCPYDLKKKEQSKKMRKRSYKHYVRDEQRRTFLQTPRLFDIRSEPLRLSEQEVAASIQAALDDENSSLSKAVTKLVEEQVNKQLSQQPPATQKIMKQHVPTVIQSTSTEMKAEIKNEVEKQLKVPNYVTLIHDISNTREVQAARTAIVTAAQQTAQNEFERIMNQLTDQKSIDDAITKALTTEKGGNRASIRAKAKVKEKVTETLGKELGKNTLLSSEQKQSLQTKVTSEVGTQVGTIFDTMIAETITTAINARKAILERSIKEQVTESVNGLIETEAQAVNQQLSSEQQKLVKTTIEPILREPVQTYIQKNDTMKDVLSKVLENFTFDEAIYGPLVDAVLPDKAQTLVNTRITDDRVKTAIGNAIAKTDVFQAHLQPKNMATNIQSAVKANKTFQSGVTQDTIKEQMSQAIQETKEFKDVITTEKVKELLKSAVGHKLQPLSSEDVQQAVRENLENKEVVKNALQPTHISAVLKDIVDKKLPTPTNEQVQTAIASAELLKPIRASISETILPTLVQNEVKKFLGTDPFKKVEGPLATAIQDALKDTTRRERTVAKALSEQKMELNQAETKQVMDKREDLLKQAVTNIFMENLSQAINNVDIFGSLNQKQKGQFQDLITQKALASLHPDILVNIMLVTLGWNQDQKSFDWERMDPQFRTAFDQQLQFALTKFLKNNDITESLANRILGREDFSEVFAEWLQSKGGSIVERLTTEHKEELTKQLIQLIVQNVKSNLHTATGQQYVVSLLENNLEGPLKELFFADIATEKGQNVMEDQMKRYLKLFGGVVSRRLGRMMDDEKQYDKFIADIANKLSEILGKKFTSSSDLDESVFTPLQSATNTDIILKYFQDMENNEDVVSQRKQWEEKVTDILVSKNMWNNEFADYIRVGGLERGQLERIVPSGQKSDFNRFDDDMEELDPSAKRRADHLFEHLKPGFPQFETTFQEAMTFLRTKRAKAVNLQNQYWVKTIGKLDEYSKQEKIAPMKQQVAYNAVRRKMIREITKTFEPTADRRERLQRYITTYKIFRQDEPEYNDPWSHPELPVAFHTEEEL